MKRGVATYTEEEKNLKVRVDNSERSILNNSNLFTPSLAQNGVNVTFLMPERHIKTIKHLKKALKLAPENTLFIRKLALAYNSAAASFRKAKEYTKAIKCLKEALKLKSEDSATILLHWYIIVQTLNLNSERSLAIQPEL